MNIDTLILCGGGPVGLVQFGILKKFLEKKEIVYEKIKNIYSTSIGSVIGLIFILNNDYNDITNYFINRPYNKLYDFNLNNFLNIIKNKGLINSDFIKTFLKSIILASPLDVDENCTFLQLYNKTNIYFNVNSTCLNDFEVKMFNYLNTPEIKVLDAIYTSCSIPILFIPLSIDNNIYLDGGFISNCPIDNYIHDFKEKIDKDYSFSNCLILYNV